MKPKRAILLLIYLLVSANFTTQAQQTQSANSGSGEVQKKSWESLHVDMPYSAGKDFLGGKTLKELVAAAENGDADSQEMLGRAYQYGFQEIERDQVKAVEWWKKAAAGGSARACLNLYRSGEDKTQGTKLLKKAADIGYAGAQDKLASIVGDPDGVNKDYREALRLFDLAAAQNHLGAMLALGIMNELGYGVAANKAKAKEYYDAVLKIAGKTDGQVSDQALLFSQMLSDQGFRIPQSRKQAVDIYQKAAQAGDAKAQYFCGKIFALGYGLAEANSDEEVNWYRKSAQQGYGLAQLSLGSKLVELANYGGADAKDLRAEGLQWLLKAAQQKIVAAYAKLGDFYGRLDGKKDDQPEAVKWYRMAVLSGDESAVRQLIFIYRKNDDFGGLRPSQLPNPDQALVKAFLKIAQQGDWSAQLCLARFYAKGLGVPQNNSEAAKWYTELAKDGNNEALEWLADAYAMGNGVTQDFVEAYKWINIYASTESAAQSQKLLNELAEKSRTDRLALGIPISPKKWSDLGPIEKRDYLASKMTPEQIAEAQRLATEFVNQKSDASLYSAKPKELSPQTKARASGTGFFISEDGFLISNHHVVEGANQVRLVTSAGLISARVVKVDAANDLALLKAEGRFAALPVAASRGVKLGGTVATVGFPNIGLQGFAPKLAKGEIASLSGAGDDARYFQISVPVQPGNSGGALVDERGNVVGVVSAKLSASAALRSSGALPENVNYAVKSSYLLSFLESVPEVAAKLKEPNTKEMKFEEVVKNAEQAAVLVLVY